MAEELGQQLREVGSRLETPPSTKDALVKLLKVRIFGFIEGIVYFLNFFGEFVLSLGNSAG